VLANAGSGQQGIFHSSPVENADTAPGLAGLGLVSGDATGTFRTVDGRLVMMNLLLGAGAKAMPGLLFLRVHSAAYLHTSNIVTCAPLNVHWCALSNRLSYSLPQQSQLQGMGPGRCPAWVPVVLIGAQHGCQLYSQVRMHPLQYRHGQLKLDHLSGCIDC